MGFCEYCISCLLLPFSDLKQQIFILSQFLGTQNFEGHELLCPPLPGKAINLAFSTSPKTLLPRFDLAQVHSVFSISSTRIKSGATQSLNSRWRPGSRHSVPWKKNSKTSLQRDIFRRNFYKSAFLHLPVLRKSHT